MIGYIFLGSCITMAIILTATTLYYRGKLKKLALNQAKNHGAASSSSNTSDNKDVNKKKKKVKHIKHVDFTFMAAPFVNANRKRRNNKNLETFYWLSVILGNGNVICYPEDYANRDISSFWLNEIFLQSRASWKHPSNAGHQDERGIRTESSTSRSYESSGSSTHHHHHLNHSQSHHEAVPILYTNNAPYEEEPRDEYDQHGVRIENQVVIDF